MKKVESFHSLEEAVVTDSKTHEQENFIRHTKRFLYDFFHVNYQIRNPKS